MLQGNDIRSNSLQAVLGRIGVSVSPDSGPVIPLMYSASEESVGTDELGAYTETNQTYCNEKDTALVQLCFRAYDTFVLASVKGQFNNANDFGKQLCFAGQNGIIINAGEMAQTDGLMANYQHKDWWTRPHFNKEWSTLPERTQSLLWRKEEVYYHLLPVCGPVFRTAVCGGASGLQIRVSSHQGGRTGCEAFSFVLGSGTDPYKLIDKQVQAALQVLDYPTLPRAQKPYPEILESLGWCSWDAFYHQVNEEGLLVKAEELKTAGLPVQWVMIDDGWSQTIDKKLSSFEADQEKFPQGLAETVRQLKDQHGIRWVGVWHTIAGYWGGIHPDSPLAKQYSDYLYSNAKGSLIPYPDAGRGFGFWHAWHSFLERQGVDFVKVDSQSAVLNFTKHEWAIGEAAAAAHQALEASASLHYNNTIINCMGMAAENMWHRPKSSVSRNSDDFVPQDQFGFAEHALQNAYNSYYHGAFYYGDWDMYWTKNHDDIQNAVLRSVSGGPIYFSDAPGNTDTSKIWPLIYGNGRIIRCEQTPNPTADILFLDPTNETVPLKLWNTASTSGVVAAFHIGKYTDAVKGTIGPSDVPGLKGDQFVLYEHFSGEMKILGSNEQIAFELQPAQCALYLIIPIAGPVTPIGLTDKYIATDAVSELNSDGTHVSLQLKEGGTFRFVSERSSVTVKLNGKPLPVVSVSEQLFEVEVPLLEDKLLVVLSVAE
ncbi:Raffinose synthase or seed imbibition protein Sip1 [Paenibacillus sp. yr247]|uniref:Sip1-related alpha-galactosidase n=1 Tax=Paenibacillus sp. yr247 TaxID=1761880 RepID=UPI00088AD3E8|nr:Sip1-related alpha-galactosidase [Paenibacillus sp. yr247]SDO38965.1 Raffinose synthase or seed imbibition protein Sip1 [Paenibacillus sp. yr247]